MWVSINHTHNLVIPRLLLLQLLHGREDIDKTEKFKKAVEQEQVRIQKETESQYISKLAELESQRKKYVPVFFYGDGILFLNLCVIFSLIIWGLEV